MEAIASLARVSKGTLYARYPTKEALLRVVVAEQVESWSAVMGANDHLLPDGLVDRLKYHARNFIGSFASEDVRGFMRLMSGAANTSPEISRALHESGYLFAVRLLAREIAEGTREDEPPARDPHLVAQALQAMLWGWYQAAESAGDVSPDEAVAFAEQAVELLFAGRLSW
jgi:TetR/AcrR family transcriptional regulator, mexJK operon transcriptional repressor